MKILSVFKSVILASPPSPTAHFTFHTMLHEPTRSDQAAEVNKALGFSPIIPSNSTTPAPTNPEIKLTNELWMTSLREHRLSLLRSWVIILTLKEMASPSYSGVSDYNICVRTHFM